MLQNLEKRVNAFFDSVIAHNGRLLPFGGAALNYVRAAVLNNLVALEGAIQQLTAGDASKYDQTVDFMVWFVKNKLDLPFWAFWAKPLVGMLVEQLGAYLKAHKDEIRDKLIAQEGPK